MGRPPAFSVCPGKSSEGEARYQQPWYTMVHASLLGLTWGVGICLDTPQP